jgi:hypothetical protein
MAATVEFIGTVLDTADSLTGWTALKISGTGGGPSAAAADGSIEGTGAVTTVVSRQFVALYFDLGGGNELDFTGGGTEEGQMIYAWAQFLAPALLESLEATNGGFGIFLESSTPGTGQYHCWGFFGPENYSGGWKRMVLDPTTAAGPTVSAGTAIDNSAIRYIGVYADLGGTTARFDNLVCDQIAVGTGIRVTGTSTTDDLSGDLLADELANRHGVFQPLNDPQNAFELNGKLVLGDSGGGGSPQANATLTDIDTKMFVAEPLYYLTGSPLTVVSAVPADFFEINFEGQANGVTDITIGKKVGTGDTASGRNGWTIVGNDTYNTNLSLDNGDVDDMKLYGSSFENLTGTLSAGTDTTHEFIGNNVIGCRQFDPGSIEVRACSFIGTVESTFTGGNGAALLWNLNADVRNSSFLANVDPASPEQSHGIEHPEAGVVSYFGLTFNGNDADIYFSDIGSPDLLTVNADSASNPATFSVDSATADVDIVNTVTLTLSNIIAGSEVRIYQAGTTTEEDGIETIADAGGGIGSFDYSYNFPPGFNVDIVVHANPNPSADIDYVHLRIEDFVLASSDADFRIDQQLDRNYENP